MALGWAIYGTWNWWTWWLHEILEHEMSLYIFFEHEIRRRPTDRREVIIRITRMFFCTLEHEIFLNTNNANDTNNYLHADLALYLKRTPIARMHVRVGTLTWGLLNENDTNEINTDSTRSFVITHCLCSVLKVESLYSFSPTIGKKAFIVLTYRKSSKSSLLYIIQCFKFSSEETSF